MIGELTTEILQELQATDPTICWAIAHHRYPDIGFDRSQLSWLNAGFFGDSLRRLRDLKKEFKSLLTSPSRGITGEMKIAPVSFFPEEIPDVANVKTVLFIFHDDGEFVYNSLRCVYLSGDVKIFTPKQ